MDVVSKGAYGAALRATAKNTRRSAVKMMAGDGDGEKKSFFDFEIGMLDGSGPEGKEAENPDKKTMRELVPKDTKAILLVNVASE